MADEDVDLKFLENIYAKLQCERETLEAECSILTDMVIHKHLKNIIEAQDTPANLKKRKIMSTVCNDEAAKIKDSGSFSVGETSS